MTDPHPTEVALEAALCNFTNGVGDSWLPTEWADETKHNFKTLSDAYNAWYSWRWSKP